MRCSYCHSTCKSEQGYSHFCNTPSLETGEEVVGEKKDKNKLSISKLYISDNICIKELSSKQLGNK